MATAAELKAQAQRAQQEANAAALAARKLAADAWRAELAERYAKGQSERQALSDKLYSEYGGGLTEAQHAIVYERAWDAGHSTSQVEVEYQDLAELAHRILAAR